MIGKLQRVPLREVWKHEALDFTTWLQENLDVLSDVLGLTLIDAERERTAGDFSVDLLAKDDAGNTVIIENQLEKSDHEHLGKILTYLTALEARTAIWIASDPRPEHIRAITWLNESRSASFYFLKVEAVKIGESPPAPLLTLIVGPTEEGREVGDTKEGLAEREVLRKRFWEQLLQKAKAKTKLHANIKPTTYNWVSTGAGRTGLTYNYWVRQHDAGIELYIDCGEESKNKAMFDALNESQAEVEAEFGESLYWQRLDGKRACRISYAIKSGGYRDDPELWDKTQDAMIDAMIRFDRALKPHIAKLNA